MNTQVSGNTPAASQAQGTLASMPTIKTVQVPSRAARVLLQFFCRGQFDETPLVRHCSYKFAASTEELKYVARRVVVDNITALELQAPPGTGKTTVFPAELARLSAEAVVVLEPTEVLARAQCATMVALGAAAVYVGMDEVERFCPPRRGTVVFTTPAFLLVWLRLRNVRPSWYQGDTTPLIVLHDESHENDGSTYALRGMWHTFPQILRYIQLSATVAGDRPEAYQRRNRAMPLIVKKYSPVEECDMGVQDQLANGEPAPWAATAVASKKVLLFVESDLEARRLTAEYSRYTPVRALRRGDTHAAYNEVCHLLRDTSSLLIIVDSSYQTGYTFDVDVVIDMGIRRQTTDIGESRAVDNYRTVTASERRQRVERVGRFKPGVAYVPDEVAEVKDSVLGPGEIGHAMAWYLLMGYTAPRELVLPCRTLMPTANLIKFLADGLPWGVWTRTNYSLCEEYPAAVETGSPVVARGGAFTGTPLKKATAQVDEAVAVNETTASQAAGCNAATELADATLEWATGIEKKKFPVSLQPGHFYRSGEGYPGISAGALERLVSNNNNGDVFRWLNAEVHTRSDAELRKAPAVDRSLKWSAWLSAWNSNEAEYVVTCQGVHVVSVAAGQSVKVSVGTESARADIEQCGRIRSVLAKWYTRMMECMPKQLYGDDGHLHVDAVAAVRRRNTSFARQMGAHHDRMIHMALARARGMIEVRHKLAVTVSSDSRGLDGANSVEESRFVTIP